MYRKELANYETYSKTLEGDYIIESSRTVYEVFVELSRDKDGNVMKNRDGTDRYYAIDDEKITKLTHDVKVKKIRDNFYKDIYEVNGDIVEKVEHDGKRVYYVVDADKIETLASGTSVIVGKNGTYRIPTEVGYVLVDEADVDNPKVLAVRKFMTDDHKKEAEEIAHAGRKSN